ncbi:MAG: regulatory protein GemA [Proteobacteria bacterium]|nr:regulatory protein GemA [Pseudomonadota bacterium]
MTNHIAAIHTLKSKLGLSEDDYRALLVNLTAKRSSKDMNQAERRAVREHLARLAEKMGLAQSTRRRPLSETAFAQAKQQASPRERKVWALWHQLHRDGKVHNPSRAALDAWVARTVHVSSLRFCNAAQLDTLIEALKGWQRRPLSPQ